ncbi:hypothetical protein AB9B67_18020, partial [Escherichia coli]
VDQNFDALDCHILKQGKHAFILSIGNRAIMHCAR